jgi:hypothetical protein
MMNYPKSIIPLMTFLFLRLLEKADEMLSAENE